ncbi:hypothetical protein F5Y16DRAFT_296533 [Xylariaceae sp. FL0255]|nr:hypothetical protein F5Y16DRAFT_296533 [Xylariaceae sp. FL0255]
MFTTVAQDPGQVNTALFAKSTGNTNPLMRGLATVIMYLTGTTPEKGPLSRLWAAFAPRQRIEASDDGAKGKFGGVKEKIVSGAYYEPVGVLQDKKKFFTDQALTNELWEWITTELNKNGAPGWPEASSTS